MTEKAFVSGGKIEMQLDGGSYTVRPAGGNAIRVTLSGNVGAAKVDVATEDTHANVSVKETPRNNFLATIEVPQTADLVIRLAAGDLKLDAVSGNKDVESNAGNVDIVTGDSKDYASVDASVQAGDIKAERLWGIAVRALSEIELVGQRQVHAAGQADRWQSHASRQVTSSQVRPRSAGAVTEGHRVTVAGENDDGDDLRNLIARRLPRRSNGDGLVFGTTATVPHTSCVGIIRNSGPSSRKEPGYTKCSRVARSYVGPEIS